MWLLGTCESHARHVRCTCLLFPKNSSVLIIYPIILLIKLPIYILPYKKAFFHRVVRLYYNIRLHKAGYFYFLPNIGCIGARSGFKPS